MPGSNRAGQARPDQIKPAAPKVIPFLFYPNFDQSSTIPPRSEAGPAKGPVSVRPDQLLAANAAVFAMMNGTDLKKAAINQAKKVATTAALAANSNGQKKRRKGDNLKPIITTENASSSLHESPTTQEEPE